MGILKSRGKSRSAPECENCGEMMSPIVYGYPSISTIRDVKRGKIALGGCIIRGDNPRWVCPDNCAEDIAEEELLGIAGDAEAYGSESEMFADIDKLNASFEDE